MEIVQLLIPADGIHVSDKALPGAEAVLAQGITLPFGKAVHHLGVLVEAGNIKGNRALNAVQIIVEAAAVGDKQGAVTRFRCSAAQSFS